MADDATVTPEVKTENTNYIEALNSLKSNSVPKEDYEKLMQENKQLLDALVNGQAVETTPDNLPSNEELRKSIFGEDTLNLEYISSALQLRDNLIAEGQNDPFLPYGTNILPTNEDIMKAEEVAKILKECVDIADGNNDVFTNELQRRLVDPILPRR